MSVPPPCEQCGDRPRKNHHHLCRFCNECAIERIRRSGREKARKFRSTPEGREIARERVRRSRRKPENRKRRREYHREYLRRRRKDPTIRLKTSVGNQIRNALREGKSGRTWEELLGYTLADLCAHLEAQFQPGMSWENYGRGGWHIDHIRPLSSFRLGASWSLIYRAAWALDNLRPMWSGENIGKNDRWEERRNGKLYIQRGTKVVRVVPDSEVTS